MRHLVASCLLLASCSDPAPAGTGSTSSAGGGDASQGGAGGTGEASVGSGSTSVTIASASSSGGSGGEGGATSSSSTSSSVTTTTATTGSGGGCPMPACDVADVGCDTACGAGFTCEDLVCTDYAPGAVAPGNSVTIHIPPVTEQHPNCAANCETGVRWAMRVRIDDGAACVAVVAPDGVLWGVSGGDPTQAACFLSWECGDGQSHPDDGIQRWVTIGVPEGVDVPSAVVTIHVTDEPGGCIPEVMEDFAAECAAVGCNGVGG